MDSLRKIAQLIRDPQATVDITGYVFALIVSLLTAIALSVLYRIFFENRATGSQIHRSFILLGPAITAIFIAIQHSLPLSLGLLGALSIIRFRTPIKEPEEIGFLFVLCACSVVVATFQVSLLVALLVVVFVGLSARSWAPWVNNSNRSDGILVVSFGGKEDERSLQLVRNALNPGIPNAKLESVSEVEGITSLQYSFKNLSEAGLMAVRRQLNEIPEVRALNVYFNGTNSLV
jgi:hypothetical protein